MLKPSFPIGKIYLTRGVNDKIAEDVAFAAFVLKSIQRHCTKDWGDLTPDDKQANDMALVEGTRILSAYIQGLYKIWIITEADRSATTILFPEEYW